MRLKIGFLLLILSMSQAALAETRVFVPGEWRFTNSWDSGSAYGQSSNHSTEKSALQAAIAAISADGTTCGPVEITSSSAWGNTIPGPGFETYASRSYSGKRSAWDVDPNGVRTCRANSSINGITIARDRTVSCPVGYSAVPDGSGFCISNLPPEKNDCPSKNCPVIGNPINTATGNKIQTEHDFTYSSSALSFDRYYTSGSHRSPSLLGKQWRHTYSRSLVLVENTTAPMSLVKLDRPDGGSQYFTLINSVWTADAGFDEKLEHTLGGGWLYSDTLGNKERYSEDGLLLSITGRNGRVLTMQYDLDQLIAVVDDQDRSLTFAYADFPNITSGTRTRLVGVGLPDGQIISYQYNANGLLEKATYPDSTSADSNDNPFRHYQYGDGITAQPHQLTGLFDESGTQYASWQYNSAGQAISSEHGAPGSGIDKVSVVYQADGSADITNEFLDGRTYTFAVINGVKKITAMSSSCPSCVENFATRTYDTNGGPDITTDFVGTQTDIDYSSTAGQVIQIIESANKPLTKRTTQIDWHATFAFRPTENRIYNSANLMVARTKYVYNTSASLTAKCEFDTANASAMSYACGSQTNAPTGVRQWTWQYCAPEDYAQGGCGHGGVLVANGPRTDVSDVTTYAYRSTSHPDCFVLPYSNCPYLSGDLWKVTNGLNQSVEFVSYSGVGHKLAQTKDINNVITDLEYNARGWLSARKVRGTDNNTEIDDVITKAVYDDVGQVTKVELPDGEYINFAYDAAHRLTGISDALNNTITYKLDNVGNREIETTKDGSSIISRKLSRAYDSLGRLQAGMNAAGATVASLTYDANDNLDMITDGLNRIADESLDPLNRLFKIIQDAGGINATTQFTYDAQDNLVKVIDPKNLNTTYTYNGLNDLTQLVSPDTGTTIYTYDSAGNRKTQKDQKTNTTTFTYDSLNRLTQSSVGSLISTFTYDGANGICGANESFAKGRLTQFADPSGKTEYCYDRFGNMTRKQVTNNLLISTFAFTFTKGGRISSITYPSGMVVNYAYNSIGETSQVTVTQGAATTTLVNNLAYLPFGPLKYLSFPVPAGGSASGALIQTRNYDNDYVVKSIGGLNYGVDIFGNIKSITDVSGGNNFEYDSLDRLSKVKDSGSLADKTAFTYDATGNRLTKKVGAATTQTYTYATTSHRLTNVGGVARTVDANGNTTGASSTKIFTYDARNRMVDFRTGSAANKIVSQYQYNAKGERVRKYLNTADQARYQYNEAGQLLAEAKIIGGITTTQEIIWLGSMPVGVNQNGVLHGILTDHLNSPRSVFELATQKTVWRWNMVDDAFGENISNEDPDANGTKFVFDMRYSGQLFDTESGLHYNYFRDYEPGTGRYVESDPIGFGGGMSTYGYVGGNPEKFADPLGLAKMNLFPHDPTPGSLWYNFNLIPDNDEECIIGGHGTPTDVGGLSPPQLANKIRRSNDCRNKRITLYACNTGLQPDNPNENKPYGKNLARETRQWVAAPDNWGWLHYRKDADNEFAWYTIGPSKSNLNYHTSESLLDADGPAPGSTGNWVYFPPGR